MPTDQDALKPLNGKEFWDLLERTAAEVSTWPEWKTGTSVDRQQEAPIND